MLRPPAFVLMAVALVALTASACSDDDDAGGNGGNGGNGQPIPGISVTATNIEDGNRPAAVPDEAEIVRSPTEFGDPAATSGDESRTFEETACSDATLTIATSKEVVYAELPCDRALPPEVADRFTGDPVRIRITIADSIKLFFESTDGGSVEFTTGRIWIDER